MGYGLVPRNKKIESIHVNDFTWPAVLQKTGAGYVIGYGEGLELMTYVYQNKGCGSSPVSNDGYKVSAKEAKAMALALHGYAEVTDFNNKEWAKLSHEDQEADKTFYQKRIASERFISTVRKIAEFCAQSSGFAIT